MVLAARQPAADDLVRGLSRATRAFRRQSDDPGRGCSARFAPSSLFRDGLVPAAGLGAEAVAARAIYKLAAEGALGYFAPVADRPGFPGALARTLGEVRLAGIGADELAALDAIGAPLAAMLRSVRGRASRRASDRPRGDARAGGRDRQGRSAAAPRHDADPDARRRGRLDPGARTLRRARRARARDARDRAARATRLRSRCSPRRSASRRRPRHAPAPRRNRSRGFRIISSAARPLPQRPLDHTVEVVSAPGEMQECVEIARRILAEADRGVPFDRIAVALHAPGRYVPYLEEALARAAIPAYFARGATRPEPGGRALLALLACAAEHLSARRYAEYLSLAQVPDPDRDGPAALRRPGP